MAHTCALAALGTLAALIAPAPAPADGAFAAAFEEIRHTVQTSFFDPKLAGLDWAALGAELAPRAATAQSLDEFAVVVNDMLDRLHASHTHLYTSRDPEYFQLLGIFQGVLREQIAAAHPDNPVLLYPGIGIFTQTIGADVFVSGVLDGGPAAEAGLRVGDRIVSVNGAPFAPVGSFVERLGRTNMEVQRTAGAPTSTLVVTPRPLAPETMFLDAMDKGIRVIQRGTARIGYVHVWSYAGDQYQDLLKSEISSGRLKDADALVIDLRGGWGGANPEYLGLFDQHVPAVAHRSRDGQERVFDPQWRKPVALLVNAGSRSGKEIFAYGFRKHHLGLLVGEKTAGAVLAGRPFLIRPGMLLYLAVEDVLVDGERLEGRGVTPDIIVPFPLPYADGADPQLDAAIDALVRDKREREK